MKVLSLFTGLLGGLSLFMGLIVLFFNRNEPEARRRAAEVLPNAQDPVLVLGVAFSGVGTILMLAAIALWTAPA